MEEYHKEDLENFRIQILEYLSYLLNNIQIKNGKLELIIKINHLIDICLDSQSEGIKFDRVKYVGEELTKLQFYYKDIMTVKQFFLVMERNNKLEKLGI